MGKVIHNMSNTRVFRIWLNMLDRCKNDRQGNWGKRGIRVCKQWQQSFVDFYADMGEPPSDKHSIDRIDNNGNYKPSNCKWATKKQQARNARSNTILKFKGKSVTLAEWSEITNIKPTTICNRLYKLGWSVEKTLTTPVIKRLPKIKPWVRLNMSRTTWYRKRQPPGVCNRI